MGREKDTRHIKSGRTVEAWHIAGDGKSTSERETRTNPLEELCSLTLLNTRIRVAKIHELEPSKSEHGIPLETRFWRRAGRGD